MLETELFAFLENTADAVFAVSEHGEVRFWSKSAVRLFGYSEAEAKDKTCFELLHGIGALGTHVCQESCGIFEWAGHATEIPNFDLNVTRKSGE